MVLPWLIYALITSAQFCAATLQAGSRLPVKFVYANTYRSFGYVNNVIELPPRRASRRSLEPIAGRLQIEPEGLGNSRHETISAFVYSPQGKVLGFSRYLPVARHCRRTAYACKPRGLTILLQNTIKQCRLRLARQLRALGRRPDPKASASFLMASAQ
jgi:hypothetical protein